MVRRPSQENLPEELDRQDVEERYQSFLEALKKISEKPVRVEYLRDEG
jgi:hypothetical protein